VLPICYRQSAICNAAWDVQELFETGRLFLVSSKGLDLVLYYLRFCMKRSRAWGVTTSVMPEFSSNSMRGLPV
jgi:hypothetical protein